MIAVFLTSAVWFILLSSQDSLNVPPQGNTNPSVSPTSSPTSPPQTQPPTPTPRPTQVQTSGTTKPSNPQFTLQYADHSYDVPPTYKTDPYTGKTEVDRSGYHVDNRTIDVTITNQPFTSFSQNGNDTVLYYYIRHKGHFEEWTEDSSINYPGVIQTSNTGNTVVSFSLEYWNIPIGGQVDFQVRAVIGYSYSHEPAYCGDSSNSFVTIGESNWSTTQTITSGSVSP
jgi:hypothetical protein